MPAVPRPCQQSAAPRTNRPLACLVSIVLFASPALAAGQEKSADDLQQVIAAWNSRRTAFRSIKVTITGVNSIRKEAFGPNTPPRDTEVSGKAVYHFDLEHGRLRVDREGFSLDAEGNPKPRSVQECFDGSSASIYHPPESNRRDDGAEQVEVVLKQNARAADFMPTDQMPVFWSIGILHPSHLYAEEFHRPLDTSEWEVVPTAGGDDATTVTAGRTSVCLRHLPTDAERPNTQKIWTVDPQHGGILKFESRPRETEPGLVFGAGTRRTVIHGYREYEFGWFPTGWEHATLDGDVARTRYNYEVTAIEFNLDWPPEFFGLPPDAIQPGTIVASEDKVRKVSEDGKTLVPLSENAAPSDVLTLKRSRRFWALVVGNSLVLATLAVWLARRNRAKDRSDGST